MVPQPAHLRYGNTRSAAEYGYVDGVVLGSSGYVRVTVSPERAELAYVTSYLPRDENAERKNGAVAHSYSVYPGVNVQTKKTY